MREIPYHHIIHRAETFRIKGKSMSIILVPMEREHTKLVQTIFNDQEFHKFLKGNIATAFENDNWLIIKKDNEPIGYFRLIGPIGNQEGHISQIEHGFLKKHKEDNIKKAYEILVKQLLSNNKKRILIKVLSNNIKEIKVFRSLGFKVEGRQKDAIRVSYKYIDIISMVYDDTVAKCVKIITTYFGDRRRPPYNAKESLRMMERNIQYEMDIDPGLDMDTYFVHNKPFKTDKVSDWKMVEKCTEELQKLHRKKTKRGTAYVIERANIGISFGAYNYAFTQLHTMYDYFCFVEDDHLIVKDNYFAVAKRQLEINPNLGFVALVKVWPYRPRKGKPCFAGGGIGFTSTRILRQVDHEYGCLPHHQNVTGISRADYIKQKQAGEYMFTGSIWSMGYDIEYIGMEKCCSCWGTDDSKSSRMVELPT